MTNEMAPLYGCVTGVSKGIALVAQSGLGYLMRALTSPFGIN